MCITYKMNRTYNTKAKVKESFKQVTPQLEEPTRTEIIFMENKLDIPENIADRNRHSITYEAIDCYSKADTQVHLKVGSKRLMPVFLCTVFKSKLHLEIAESEIAEQENLVNEGRDDA